MKDKPQKVLVTGSGGLVGTALQSIRFEYPQCEFVFTTSKDGDLTKLDDVCSQVERHRPDAILNLAALRGGIGLSARYPATVLRDNVLMSLHILEAARMFKPKKVVMSLSSGMYPSKASVPYREESVHDGPPHESNYGYAFAKRLIEPLVRAYRTEYEMNVIGLIPNGIFGENDDYNEENATFIAALIRRFHECKGTDSEIVVWGDGTPLRELTYSTDMARAFMWALLNYDGAEILNIGTVEEHSIQQIAWMIADALEIDRARIVFDPKRPQGIHRKSTDNSQFVKLSGFQYTPFEVGLRKTVEWVKANAPWRTSLSIR